MSITLETFNRLDIRVGRIIEVEQIPEARKPMYKLQIDFGELGKRQCVAGVKAYYSEDGLKGKEVVAVMNLEPKKIAGVVSECMMLAAFTDKNELALLEPDKEMPLGTKVA